MDTVFNINIDLVQKIKEGDQKSFDEVFYKYSERLYWFAFRYLKNKEDAEEVVQDVFVSLWNNRHNINEQLSFSGYLYTIAKNTIFKQNRRNTYDQTFKQYLLNTVDLHQNKTENDLIFEDLRKLADQTIDTFPKQRKLIYKLSRDKGLSYKEIAQTLDISERTVESHIRLALKTLKSTLDQHLIIPLLLICGGFVG